MKAKKARNSAVGKVGASVLSVAAALGACDSTEEQLRAIELGGQCAIDSECEGDLVCVFEHCHVECDDDKDCKDFGGRCVRVPQGDAEQSSAVGVCQLPSESECENDDGCKGKQVCAVDLECRDLCSTSNPCFPGFVCATSGQCALPVELNASGNLGPKTQDPGGEGAGGNGSGSQGGAAGSGGVPSVSSGGSTAAGGASSRAGSSAGGGDASAGESSSGGNETEGGATGGSTGASGASSEGGAPNDGIVYDYAETADGVELVANEDYDHPIPVSHRVKLHLGGADNDWLAVTPPMDGLSHIISLRVVQDTPLSTTVKAVSQADFSTIDSTHFSAGVTSFAYVTAGPNTTILFGFVSYPISGSIGFADITFDIVPENDAYEPNNTKADAAKITLGTTITGQILNPYVSQIDRPREDWYAIDLEPGTATVQILDTPDEGAFTINRVAPNGAVASVGSAPVGGTATPPAFSVPEAGTYYLQIVPNTVSATTHLVAFSSGAKPAYLDQQYSFVVTQ